MSSEEEKGAFSKTGENVGICFHFVVGSKQFPFSCRVIVLCVTTFLEWTSRIGSNFPRSLRLAVDALIGNSRKECNSVRTPATGLLKCSQA